MLDHKPATGLDPRQHETGNTLASFPALSAGVRWHCAWTCQQRENIAAQSIRNAGFASYLPLHYQPGLLSRWRIVPLFPRYCFVAFDPDRDPWGKIADCRGVCGLIRHGYDLPTPVPDHAIDELLARTSARGVVDDPGERSWEGPGAGYSPVWLPMVGLDAGSRVRLLTRLFGASVTKRAMEDAA